MRGILTIEDWKNINRLRLDGYRYCDISKIYGVTEQCIQQGLDRRKKQFAILCHIFNN